MNISEALVKTDEWMANRQTGIGGSDAGKIMAGDAETLLNLWREKRGEVEGDDLSDVLPVQMGSWTEPFNRYWFSKQTEKPVTEDMRECRHTNDISRCELDGWIVGENAIFEAKHTNAFAKSDEVQTKYYWQVQHQMACSDTERCYLSAFFGNMKWEHYVIERNQEDIDRLIEAEEAFWAHVQDGTPPVVVGAVASVSHDEMRSVYAPDEPFANEFADFAATWKETQGASKKFTKADKGLKAFIGSDVKKLFGFGLEITRAGNGSRRIKETKNADTND
jgi:putative phage-type endonuclease